MQKRWDHADVSSCDIFIGVEKNLSTAAKNKTEPFTPRKV